ncbi:MAG: single-stranded DNA-binding protein [Ahrensia sp.]|nr:single-stranded DNA-binding protein [Ahrensia sp.]
MKTITIAGNIGKDAEIRKTQNGDAVTSWSVAVEDRKGQEKQTIWFDCSLWGNRGEALAQYLTKGSKVSVSGEFSAREHEGRTYLTVSVDRVTLLGSKLEDGRGDLGGYSTPSPRRESPAARPGIDDDDIPF